MKLVKTSAIAVAISALLAGPVLAQGASPDAKVRGKTQMQSGASGNADEDVDAGGAGRKAGATAKTKGTVGAGTGTPKVTGGAIPPATGR
jgi:hypothetical protein